MLFLKTYKLTFLAVLFSVASFAHEVRPAFFSIIQVSDSTYKLVWKLPAQGDATPKIYPTLPQNWSIDDQQTMILPGSLKRIYSITVDKGIEGASILFDGQEKTLIDILVSVKLLNGVEYTQMVKPAEPIYQIPSEPGMFDVIRTYGILGIEHILFGIDHLLFVLALLLIAKGLKKLLFTITAFTIAHSITLTMAALGVVGLPGPPVEAVIALSIVFLAVELVHSFQGKRGYTFRYPWVVAFIFGLLHGFGFAGALAEIGLPQNEIVAALFFFNVGVEAGQIMFVLVVIFMMWWLRKIHLPYHEKLRWIMPYVIGSIASFWLIERVVGFW